MANKGEYEHFIPPAKEHSEFPGKNVHILIESIEQLEEALSNPSKYIAWDTETSSLDPSTGELVGFSFSFDGKTGYYVPLAHYMGNNLPREALDKFYDRICKAQMNFLYNMRFDYRWMGYQGYDMSNVPYYDVAVGVWLADTNVKFPSLKWAERHFLGWDPSTFEETLGDATSFRFLDVKDAYVYACVDAEATFAVCMATVKYYQESKLAGKLENQSLYPLMRYEQETLIVDTDYLRNCIAEETEHLRELQQDIFKTFGYQIKLNSGKQLGDALQQLGIHTGEYTATGLMKTDIKTLDRVNLQNHNPVLTKIIEQSQINKALNSYFEALLAEAERMGGVSRFNYLTNNVPCLTESARVTIRGKGIISIKDVEVGDYIWTQYGWKKVLWNNSHWSDEIWTVELKNGRKITGTGHHPLLVNESGRNDKWKPMWVPMSALTSKDKVCLNHNTVGDYDYDAISYPELRSERTFRNSFTIPKFGPRVARMLGFIDGDGSIASPDRVSLSFNESDKDLVYYYVNEFRELFGIEPKFDKVGSDHTLRVNFFSVRLRNWFVDLGSRGNGVPEIVIRSNPECWANYLAGMWDSDGCLMSANGRYNPRVKLANEKTIKDIQLLMINLGMPTHVTKVKKERGSEKQRYQVDARGGMGRCYFRDLIAPGLICGYKRERAESIDEKFVTGSLSWVDKVYKELEGAVVYDIEVEDVHEYVAEGIVNHNTARLASGADKKNPYFTHLNVQCLAEGTRVLTTGGMVPIETVEMGELVWTGKEFSKAVTAPSKKKRVVSVNLGHSLSLKASEEHKILAVTEDGLEWVSVGSLHPGQFVAVNRQIEEKPDVVVELHSGQVSRPQGGRERQEIHVAKPLHNFWTMLGWFVGDGCFNKGTKGEYRGVSLSVSWKEQEVIPVLEEGLSEVGLSFYKRSSHKEGYKDITVLSTKSVALSDILSSWGLQQGAYNKRIPSVVFILGSNQIRLFLKGLFSSDGTNNSSIQYKTVSRGLAEDIQSLLLQMGYISTICEVGDAFNVLVHGKARFLKEIGFIVNHKISDASAKYSGLPTTLYKIVEKRERGSQYKDNIYVSNGHLINDLELLASAGVEEANYSFEQVQSIEPAGESRVYDLWIPEVNQFVAEGVIVHNSSPKPHPQDWYVHDYYEGDEILPGEFKIMRWVFSTTRKSNRIIEGFNQKNNFRSAFKVKDDEYWVSCDYCISPETLVELEDGSKVPLKFLEGKSNVKIKTPGGFKRAFNFRYTGKKKKCKLRLKDGREVICSPDHKFKVIRDGNEMWLPLKDIRKSDYILTD